MWCNCCKGREFVNNITVTNGAIETKCASIKITSSITFILSPYYAFYHHGSEKLGGNNIFSF